ncbi:hypothetical protein RvY_15151-2 [Ramazzottius varieornatus]|nr:hypothetical protein RvY_15151-2 [Ramazzottius varieornatus]
MQRKPKTKDTGQGSRISVGETKRRKPCRMLVACVLLYSLTQAPSVVLNTVDHFSNAPYCHNLLTDYEDWEPLVTTLALVNYAGNFYVYVLMSSTYRTALKDSFRRHIKRVWRPSKTDGRTFSQCGNQSIPDKERGVEGEKYLGTCTDFDWLSLTSHVSVLFSASRKTSDEPAKSRLRKVRHSLGGHPGVRTEKFRLASLEDIASENQTLSNNAHRNSL